MRALALAVALAAAHARAGGLGFVYVTSNVGTASGGHAALLAGETVYHLQNTDAGLLLLTRDSWPAFHLLYAELENRPLEIARLGVSGEVGERVERAFARLYVEQELALARRESLRDDVAWLESLAARRPLPPLRGAGLVAPDAPGDPDAARLRGSALARAGGESLTRVREEAGRRIAALAVEADPAGLASLREALLLREAARALEGAWGLDARAIAALPAELDVPLRPEERAGLEALSAQLEVAVGELLRSARPDRGYALLLAQARYLAARRSLAANRLVLLDAFAGAERVTPPDDADESTRAKRRAQAGALLGEGRARVLASGTVDEADWNLLEEAASIAARDGRADAVGPLSQFGLRKLPARARSLDSPELPADLARALAEARARLARQDALLQARWSYDIVRRNCITELARTTDGAFGSPEEAARELGAPASADDRLLGFVPFAFFQRVRDRLRVERVDSLPSRRESELARVLGESPGLVTRLEESTVFTSSIYRPRLRDGAFLLFSDDVFWPRPAFGVANLIYALGYTGYGLVAAPFARAARAAAGLSGVMWSVPELAFVNVRKGSFDWAD
ncbi:MAG: hypothetical protein ACHQ6T_04905 [Myxococcota bacterium]